LNPLPTADGTVFTAIIGAIAIFWTICSRSFLRRTID